MNIIKVHPLVKSIVPKNGKSQWKNPFLKHSLCALIDTNMSIYNEYAPGNGMTPFELFTNSCEKIGKWDLMFINGTNKMWTLPNIIFKLKYSWSMSGFYLNLFQKTSLTNLNNVTKTLFWIKKLFQLKMISLFGRHFVRSGPVFLFQIKQHRVENVGKLSQKILYLFKLTVYLSFKSKWTLC